LGAGVYPLLPKIFPRTNLWKIPQNFEWIPLGKRGRGEGAGCPLIILTLKKRIRSFNIQSNE
jgi:hypothetical protein